MKYTTGTTNTTVAAIAGVCLALTLTACGSSGGGAADKAPDASPPIEFNPKLTMQPKTLKYGDKSTVTVDAKVPKVTGVEPSIADGYTKAFRADLMKELKEKSVSIESGISGGSEEQCDEHTKGKCITHARFKQHDAQIYKSYATVSYELGISPFGAHPETTVKSLTVDLRTGQPAKPSDFINTSDSNLASAIKKGSCLENYDEDPASAKGFEAFSPTDKGFNATWSAGTHSFDGCGIGNVTLPWSDFGKDEPSPSASGSVQEPSEKPEAAGNACAGSPQLPKNADPQICSDKPKNVIALKANQAGFAEFSTPIKNIMCELRSDYVECLIVNPGKRVRLGTSGKAHNHPGSEPVTTFDRVTLKHGQTGTFKNFVCSSRTTGVACWNTKSKHGLFLSKAKQVLW